MKNSIIIAIFFLPMYLAGQSGYPTAGAQCGTHGSGGCEHFQTPCPPGADASIHLILRTDNQGFETGYQLFDVTDNVVLESGQNLLSKITYDIQICAYRDHCYRLTLTDSGNNGIDPAEGGFELFFNGEQVAEGRVFTDILTVDLGGCCSTLDVRLSGGFACYDASTGQVVASITGGVPPYAYVWSTGATHTTTLLVSPDDDLVSVVVTDAAGCAAADALSLTSVGPFGVTAEATAPTVKGAVDGKAGAVPTGGIQPYTYNWSTGAGAALVSGLAAGTYTVTVLDASGCSAVEQVVVPEGPSGVHDTAWPLAGLALFPNPATGQTTLLFTAREGGDGLVQIVDPSGQLRHREFIRVIPGENQVALQVQTLPPGAYLVSVRVGKEAGSRWLVLAR